MANLLDKASILITPTAYDVGSINAIKPTVSYGSEIIINGDFSNGASNWTLGTQWSVSSGQATVTNSASGQSIYQSVLTSNKKYLVSVEIVSITTGSIKIGIGTNFSQEFTQAGVYTFTGIQSADLLLRITPSIGATATVDNVSAKEVISGDLTFDRGTSATQTRVAGSNYIQSVGQDIPRLDFRGANHWLFEPQATNTATYSNDFSQGSIFVSASASSQNVVLTSAQGTSPDGTNNAWKIALSDATDNLHHLRYTNTTVVSDNVNVLSIFAKKGSGVDWLGIFADNLDATNRAWFDLENGVKGTLTNGLNSTMEDYGNGWYRCSLAFSSTTDLQSEHVRIVITNADGSSSYAGSTSDYHLIYGLQAESTSTSAYDYPTSYIPTSGSTATRDNETATDSGNATLFGQTEGVLYSEIAAFDTSSTQRTIQVSDNSSSTEIQVGFNSNGNFNIFSKLSNTTSISLTSQSYNADQFYKIAIRYKSGDSSIFIDGTEVATSTTAYTNTDSISELNLGAYWGGISFYGKVKCIAFFKEGLTDTELQCLTS